MKNLGDGINRQTLRRKVGDHTILTPKGLFPNEDVNGRYGLHDGLASEHFRVTRWGRPPKARALRRGQLQAKPMAGKVRYIVIDTTVADLRWAFITIDDNPVQEDAASIATSVGISIPFDLEDGPHTLELWSDPSRTILIARVTFDVQPVVLGRSTSAG